VGFMVSKAASGRVFLPLVWFFAVSITTTMLRTHSSVTDTV
jgi:hypothetical protein